MQRAGGDEERICYQSVLRIKVVMANNGRHITERLLQGRPCNILQPHVQETR